MGAEETAVRYVGGHDEVEIGETGQIVARGEAVLVPTDVAGRAPKGDPGDDGYDYGEGLLAQPSNWEKARKSDVGKDDESADGDAADDQATAAEGATVETIEE